MTDESSPIPLAVRATDRERKQIVKFDPTLNSGHILQIIVLVVGGMLSWSAYVADRERTKIEVEQIRKDVDVNKVSLEKTSESNRSEVRQSLSSINSEMKDINRSISLMATDVAVMKVQQSQKGK